MAVDRTGERRTRRLGYGSLRHRRIAALVAPLALTASAYVVFRAGVGWLGLRAGYLLGFLFFWSVWCLGFSLWAIGAEGVLAVVRDTRPRLPTPAALWILLLAFPVVGGFATVLLPDLDRADPLLVTVALGIAVVNGSLEELLWRGVYVRLFPGDPLLAWLYPAAAFAAWHVAPTSVLGSAGILVPAALYLGLVYGWIAYRTGTVRWTILGHVLVNAMGLSFATLVLGR